MIRFHQNSEIDRMKWDDCIKQSSQGLVYGLSWYLDLVSPGWHGLVEGDYSAVMPLPVKKKYGIHYVMQPLYAQQLGIFSGDELPEPKILEFINNIPLQFKYIGLNLNYHNLVTLPQAQRLNNNFELALDNEYALIEAGYSSNTRRNLRKATGLNISFEGRPEELLKLKAENTGGNRRRIQPAFIKNFISAAMDHGTGFICSASLDGTTCAAVFFLHFQKRIYYLIPVSNKEGREKKAMFAIIDLIIQKFSGSRLTLDFEGSNIQGIARFFEGFGAENNPYPSLTINRLPFPLNQLRKF